MPRGISAKGASGVQGGLHEYYIKHNIDCPTYHYDESESSAKSYSGAETEEDNKSTL